MKIFMGFLGVAVVIIGILLGLGIEVSVLMIIAYVLYWKFHG